MKKRTKEKKSQLLLRIEVEEHTRLTELGASAGFPSANKFVIESMLRYGDVLADVIIAENAERDEVSKRHRERLRAKIQSSRR